MTIETLSVGQLLDAYRTDTEPRDKVEAELLIRGVALCVFCKTHPFATPGVTYRERFVCYPCSQAIARMPATDSPAAAE